MTAPSFMDLALKAAETARKSGEVPIGCVIVLNHEVIATAGNRTLTDRDPTAHAEMLAIRAAAQQLGSERLVGCDLHERRRGGHLSHWSIFRKNGRRFSVENTTSKRKDRSLSNATEAESDLAALASSIRASLQPPV